MPDSHPCTGVRLHAPHPALADYVACYWVSRSAGTSRHRVLPDGCVDLVCAWAGTAAALRVHGSTTRPRELAVAPDGSYVGVRFRPGQARRFVEFPAALLTDTDLAAEGAVPWAFALRSLGPHGAGGPGAIDRALLAHLARRQVRRDAVDALLGWLAASAETPARAGMAIDRLGRLAGTGPRQAERHWRAAVGLPMETFLGIQRVRRAARALRGTTLAIADVALRAGYADQSHLTRATRRYLGATPGTLRRAEDVGIVQDGDAAMREDAHTHTAYTRIHSL
ncbi:DUF6597 domain-containing transcriptional factor [Verticiella sediminum]